MCFSWIAVPFQRWCKGVLHSEKALFDFKFSWRDYNPRLWVHCSSFSAKDSIETCVAIGDRNSHSAVHAQLVFLDTRFAMAEELGSIEQAGSKRKNGPVSPQQLAKRPRYGEERKVPPPKKRNPGVSFSDQHFGETTYYFEGGLRKVRPYYFDFETYCKGRWVGKSLLEVFSSEFRAEPIEYYRAAAKAGRLRLNGEPVKDLNMILKNNDFMRNTVHRHEPPVTAQPIEILVNNEDVVVVDKPSSLPVHPCGRFRHNTVIFILGKEHGLKELHTIHRLDRMTSGVLMFAKTAVISKKIDEQVRERKMEKEYVCRVEGEFPEGEVICEEPILVVSFKVGVCRVDPKGKPCKTVFQRVRHNGKSSVVRCIPYTGRTHQIRVHLQYLGHPIINDPIYNVDAWGPEKGKSGKIGKTDEQLLEALINEHQTKQSLNLLDLPQEDLRGTGESKTLENCIDCTSSGQVYNSSCINPCHIDSNVQQENAEMLESVELVRADSPYTKAENSSMDNCKESDHSEMPVLGKDFLCGECKLVRRDPCPKDLVMYLHALRYKSSDFEYASKMPTWATDDWNED